MRVYTFGDGAAEGSAAMVSLLGGKGAGLAAMSLLGVPVPPGFTLPTTVCHAFFGAGDRLPDAVWPEIDRGLAYLEAVRGQRFGDPERPLLVSVRSGAARSMPGMLDTILNVGLNDETVRGLERLGTGRRFALDSYRRFVEMWAEIVLELDPGVLHAVRDEVLAMAGAGTTAALDPALLEGLVVAYKKQLEAASGRAIPDDPRAQLREAVSAVFRSWRSRRAARYRREHGIDDGLGTAVTIQAMVFGNLGPDSATGVAFTRCPNTGEPRLFGEYLPDAQGEDVVRGLVTPLPLARADAEAGLTSLEESAPAAFAELQRIAGQLERHFRDAQDLEFTIEAGRVWMLQTRPAQRSVRADVRIAVDMVAEGLVTRDEALLRVHPLRLQRLIHPSVDVEARRRIIGRGLPASPGAVSGVAIFDPDEAIERASRGEAVILVRVETSPEDMAAIQAVAGVLTARGGMTSHAALVARGLGRCAVTGCADIVVDERAGRFTVRNQDLAVAAGTRITIDGTTGEVILGEVATCPADPPPAYRVLMGWADERRRLRVRANADNAADARAALDQGAEGVGLCRTEHMFLERGRLQPVRELVYAPDERARREALDRILPAQRADFVELFAAVGKGPVAIRLLDLTLHDLTTADPEELHGVARALETHVDVLAHRTRQLRAANPLLGHRGCRLGLTFPELYEVQVRAAVEARLDTGAEIDLQIVVPLVTAVEEMVRLRRRVTFMIERVCGQRGVPPFPVAVGAMIEVPRACLIAGELAAACDFFLFGTNDLTITTFGFNRDDAGRFLPFYLENEVLPADPFVQLDEAGVGALVRLAVERGRAARPDLVCGLTGAQVGDPGGIEFCHRHGIDYVSCPPHTVPIARLAAAQAAIRADDREPAAGAQEGDV